MLTFTEYQIDQELLSLSEDLQKGFITSLLGKLEDSKKKEIQSHIVKVNKSNNREELDRYADHPHFAVRLAVARNKNTHPNTLKRLKTGHSEYKSVSNAAEDTLKQVLA